ISAAGHGPGDETRLRPRSHRLGQGSVRRLMRQIFLAGEEPDERPPLLRDVVADRAAQHRVTGLQRVQDRALRRLTFDVELYLAADARQVPQMGWEHHSDHGSIWTSTDTTAGRSRTMGAQLFPESADAHPFPAGA